MPEDEIGRHAVEKARAALDQAMGRSRQLARALAANAAALKRLLRSNAPQDEQVQRIRAEHARLSQELEQARAAIASAQSELSDRLAEWLSQGAEDDLARLSADFPVLLFPVRLETRFDTPSGQSPALKLRIYPDTILAEAHEPLLTREEYQVGVAYWGTAWTDEAQAWRELVRQTRPQRAAWIVLVTRPTNLDERPLGEPHVPEVELRTESWDRPTETRLLPDRWLVLAYRQGHEVLRALSRPVQQPLAVGFDPQAPLGEAIDVSGDGLRLDPQLAWTVDFARAEEIGMAISIPLDALDLQRGFDRLLVFGVKGSLSPEASQAALERLFESHHYSAGMALVAQGTPTNNTEATPSSYPPPDPDGTHSFTVERGRRLDTENGDGARLTRVLGLPASLLAHIEGADRTEQVVARAMNVALWPATWGYFLKHMMAPHVGEDAIRDARQHFVEFVCGRGPLPALRVRGQPYGVLPVSSLQRWQARPDAAGAAAQLPGLLRRCYLIWAEQVGNVPRVGRSQDADADLLAILGMDASTRQVRARRVHGPDFQRNLLAFMQLNPAAWEEAQLVHTRPVMDQIGLPNWNPRMLRMNFVDRARLFRYPLVAPPPLSEETSLTFDYVRWAREATIQELRDEQLPDGSQPPQALLYDMLRHARLVEFARVAVDLAIAHSAAQPTERLESELLGVVDGTRDRPTIWQRFERPIPALTGQTPLGDFLHRNRQIPETKAVADHDTALQALEGLPTAELQRLFTETLDLCSHRLDAWVTSLATQRLAAMREANPTGIYVGAFGWLEDLRPAEAAQLQTVTLSDGQTVRISHANDGYIHAPSMTHASAAAVLRNGYRTRNGQQGAPYAIDLSSRRVRAALTLLDAVRQGQPLGAVLGYQFERGLHEGHRPLELSRYIEPLRRRFPLVANKTEDTGKPADAVAARNVVDGLALRDAWKKHPQDLVNFLHGGDPPSARELAAVEAELRRMDEAIDAVADVLTAEAVYQIANGSADRANASLDAIAKGSRPPDPAIARQPRHGIVLTHRVAIVLGGNPPDAPGWEGESTPRALAEPFVDGWAGQLLGDPHSVRCRVKLALPGAVEATLVQVTLAELGLRPIDVLALTQETQDGPALTAELERRIAEVASRRAPAGTQVEIVYARDGNWPREQIRTFPEILEVARTLNKLLANSRPLAPTDLAPAEDRPMQSQADVQDDNTLARATRARNSLRQTKRGVDQAIVAADPDKIAQALRLASLFGIPGAFPGSVLQNAAPGLMDVALSVQSEIARRLAQSEAAKEAVAIALAVFGPGLVFLPRFLPPEASELGQALSAAPALVGDRGAPERWMYQSSRVRPALARWRKLALYSKSLGTYRGTLDVVQLPFAEGARWVGLPFSESEKPPSGRLSLVLHRVAQPQPEKPWVGLVLDEWPELIPEKDATTGIAFHYDTPGAEPPQAILIAVPPTNAERWSQESLVATLNETLDMARVRAVDGELLGELGQVLPAIFLATNPANDTVSTDLRGALVAEIIREA